MKVREGVEHGDKTPVADCVLDRRRHDMATAAAARLFCTLYGVALDAVDGFLARCPGDRDMAFETAGARYLRLAEKVREPVELQRPSEATEGFFVRGKTAQVYLGVFSRRVPPKVLR